ncbi:MAG: hypothetical protein QGD93_11500 [Actinomycetota bacterium]|nr:hypothetical protein [Actinomycetota bacterium]
MSNPNGFLETMIAPTTATTGSTLIGYVDLKGWDYCEIDVVGTTVITTKVAAVLKLAEDDTETDATSMTDIDLFTGGNTTVGFTIPITVQTVTLKGNTMKFRIDCRKRKRYVGIVIQPSTTQTYSVTANKFKGISVDAAQDFMLGVQAG